MQTCWQERSRGWVVAVVVCLHVVEGGGSSRSPRRTIPARRKQTQEASLTAAHTHSVCGRRERSDWCSTGPGLRGGHDRCEPACYAYEGDEYVCELRVEPKAGGEVLRRAVQSAFPHGPAASIEPSIGAVLTTPRQLFPPLLPALLRVTTCTVNPPYRVCRSTVESKTPLIWSPRNFAPFRRSGNGARGRCVRQR